VLASHGFLLRLWPTSDGCCLLFVDIWLSSSGGYVRSDILRSAAPQRQLSGMRASLLRSDCARNLFCLHLSLQSWHRRHVLNHRW